MSTTTNLYSNPYKSTTVPADDWLRISVDVCRSEVAAIKAVTMEYGTIRICTAMFIRHLNEYVKRNNLSISDRERFVRYVVHKCTAFDEPVVDSNTRPSSGLPHGQGPDRNDGSGVGRVGESNSGTTDIATAVQREPSSASTEGQRRSGRGKSK